MTPRERVLRIGVVHGALGVAAWFAARHYEYAWLRIIAVALIGAAINSLVYAHCGLVVLRYVAAPA